MTKPSVNEVVARTEHGIKTYVGDVTEMTRYVEIRDPETGKLLAVVQRQFVIEVR